MTPPTQPNDDMFDSASSRLNEGLRSCRAVLSNYRSLLTSDGEEETSQSGFNQFDGSDETAVD